MNLADPQLELIDPTPNIHSLFVHFDELFFWAKLMGRAVLRWSKKMYSCAGVCRYEGRGGVCDIALSEPLLKLRPRKDLIETLLHEMIHAFLFITNRDTDRDGHGPNFQAHMHRINKAAGLNISIYHDFHDEVKLYLKHWWRCNGKCQNMKPYFGVVRRSVNRAPGPHEYWWTSHKKMCGGTFIKIKEPEKPQKVTKKPDKIIPNSNITKYINNNNNTILNKNATKSIIKENKTITSINVSTAVAAHTKSPEIKNTDLGRKRSNSTSVRDTVRNVWINKKIPSSLDATSNAVGSTIGSDLLKRTNDSVLAEPSPKKVKKIDDYFNASRILKDIYGEEFVISQSNNGTKLKAVTVGQSSKVPPVNIFVDCPICNAKIYSNDINKHIDECLNKDLIEKLSKDSIQVNTNPVRLNTDNHTKRTSTDNSSQTCPSCGVKVYKSIESHLDECLGFFDNDTTIPEEGGSNTETVADNFNPLDIKSEPGTSKETFIQKCPCCGQKIDKLIELHLDECLGFFDNNATIPIEGASGVETIVIDDEDDDFDETQTFNATGTKSPCPCCLKMVEVADMNNHLDVCLSKSLC